MVNINTDLIDLNAPKSDAVKIYFTVPRLSNYSELGNLENIFKEFTQSISINNSRNRVLIGYAQSINFIVTRGQVPIETLSSAMLVHASTPTTRGQCTISSLLVPGNILKAMREVDNHYLSLNEELKNVLKEFGNFLFKLSSDTDILFDISELSEIPFGIMLEFYNKSSSKPIARKFLEACKLTSLSSTINANSAIFVENISFMFHRIIDL